ncbi:MAG: glycosyltransferase family 1 protein, partial [Armatimonadetes bacterium]|nr:glycosyltransferase family 1 protein [Armatimonadota bacterium]
MGFRVLHFSSTPLAGAPIRLVQALREHTDHEVRLVDLQRWGLYDHDLVFSEQPDEVVELAAKADIIHLHNYLDSHSTCFAPIDFERLRRRGTALVRQFHTHPEFVAQVMGVSPSAVLSCPLPSLVIAQSQERFYPQARVSGTPLVFQRSSQAPRVLVGVNA